MGGFKFTVTLVLKGEVSILPALSVARLCSVYVPEVYPVHAYVQVLKSVPVFTVLSQLPLFIRICTLPTPDELEPVPSVDVPEIVYANPPMVEL